MDILTAAAERILSEQRKQIIKDLEEVDRRTPGLVRHERRMVLNVGDHPGDHFRDVIGLPIAVHIGFPKTHISEKHAFLEEIVMEYADIRMNAPLPVAIRQDLSVGQDHGQSSQTHGTKGMINEPLVDT